MSSIKGMLPSAVQVLRDGKEVMVQAADLVTGDIVYMSMGQKIPADIRLIDCGGDLKFDRAVLTGEVCINVGIPSLLFMIFCRANRSLEELKRRMITSLRSASLVLERLL